MKSKAILFWVITIISCLLLLQYHLYYTTRLKGAVKNVGFKNILYWTKMFGVADFYLGMGSENFKGCEVSNCYTTDNRGYVPVDQFDAIVFHGSEYFSDEMGKPESRSRDQYYIYSNLESPVYTSRWFGSENFFNWTMTYRFDSDIVRPYGYYEKTTTDYKMPTVEEIQKRPFKIAWMVSNCDALSNRKELFKKLSRYIPIDVYGACGNKTCPMDQFDICFDRLALQYKFYLSFENSICSDYVTEKLYAVLTRDLVPIVYGGADYAKVAPPHSVIDVSKFDSVKELAEYVRTLDENPEKYLTYFEWKRTYVALRDRKPTLCTLCKKLNEPIVYKSYNDVFEWWYLGMCRLGKKLPKIVFS